ncbi:hypothetical protein E2542_SST08296 [Spatholobus suberectus]|nr:hypothetical protein E2542_SST08296 [Spatholobus suberectus]
MLCKKKEGIDTFPSKEILYCCCEIHSVGKLGGVKLEFLDALEKSFPSRLIVGEEGFEPIVASCSNLLSYRSHPVVSTGYMFPRVS